MSNKKLQRAETATKYNHTNEITKDQLIEKIRNLVMEGVIQTTRVNILESCMMIHPNENKDDTEQLDSQIPRIDTEEICKVIDDIIYNENLTYYNMLCYAITITLVKRSGVISELASMLFSLMAYDVNIREKSYSCEEEALFRARDCRILLDTLFMYMVKTSVSSRDIFDPSKLSYTSFMMSISDTAALIQRYCPVEINLYNNDYEEIKNTLMRFLLLSHSDHHPNNMDDINILVSSSIL